MEIVDVVDENDSAMRRTDRNAASPSDILRCVGVFIADGKEKIFLQLRAGTKQAYPLSWDCTAGGHVVAGESYEAAASRELLEETGLRTNLAFLGKHHVKLDDGRRHWIAFFRGVHDGAIDFDSSEIAEMRSFSAAELAALLEHERVHPECRLALETYDLFN